MHTVLIPHSAIVVAFGKAPVKPAVGSATPRTAVSAAVKRTVFKRTQLTVIATKTLENISIVDCTVFDEWPHNIIAPIYNRNNAYVILPIGKHNCRRCCEERGSTDIVNTVEFLCHYLFI